MRLNKIAPHPAAGAKAKRRGRGTGSGLGKTAGRGHKGQKSRSGGYHKVGFEGGQMPIQRRLPKVGFSSRRARVTAEVRLHELMAVEAVVIDVAALKAARLINKNIERVKVMCSGSLNKAVTVRGLGLSKGASAAIKAAGGRIEA